MKDTPESSSPSLLTVIGGGILGKDKDLECFIGLCFTFVLEFTSTPSLSPSTVSNTGATSSNESDVIQWELQLTEVHMLECFSVLFIIRKKLRE